jgi:AhpD family alkylhydroperoxidase
MEILSIAIISFILRLGASNISARRAEVITIAPARESICLYCLHAHIARGYKASEELTYCTYAGPSREVKFAVSDCSMFCHRYTKAEIVRIIGFADVIPDSQVIRAAARLNTEN